MKKQKARHSAYKQQFVINAVSDMFGKRTGSHFNSHNNLWCHTHVQKEGFFHCNSKQFFFFFNLKAPENSFV